MNTTLEDKNAVHGDPGDPIFAVGGKFFIPAGTTHVYCAKKKSYILFHPDGSIKANGIYKFCTNNPEKHASKIPYKAPKNKTR
jgi:hypothetical protein